MNIRQCCAGVLLAACCALAHAQWEWRDANNVRHFSDQPPPASVPSSRILKAPRGQLDLRRELAEKPAPAASPRPAAADGNAAFAQRRAEAVERERRAAAQARNRAADAAACDDARANLRVLESGMRVATAAADGAPAFLDDAQKAQQIERNRNAIATHCK
jgi:Domain of unknown function (DUF4124)